MFLCNIFGVLLIYVLGAAYSICALGLCASHTTTVFS